jgi:hypothetical protein
MLLLLAGALAAAPPELVFQSPGGDALVVARVEPEVGDEPADAVELVVLLRKGEAARPFRASELLEASELAVRSGRVLWLGSGSRTVRRGAELHLSSGRRLVVPFDGKLAGKSTPIPVAPPRCPCSFLDDEETLHVVDVADEVPRKFWNRAHSLDETAVQVMPMPPPPPRAAEPAAPAAPPSGRRVQAAPEAPAPPVEDYYEYIKRITGQRGLESRTNCIGNDGKPTPCRLP